MESKNLLIENEDSVTSVDMNDSYKVVCDSDNGRVKFTNAEDIRREVQWEARSPVSGRRSTGFNIDLLKAAFQALGQAGQQKDTYDDSIQEINLSFCNLSYSVKNGIRRGKQMLSF